MIIDVLVMVSWLVITNNVNHGMLFIITFQIKT